MALILPTYRQIRDQILAIWQGYRPDADAGEYSDLWLYARLVADLVYRLHLSAERILTAMHPATTHGDALGRWLETFGLPDGQGGYGRIPDAGSSGVAALQVTATGATADLLGQQLTDGGGRTYEITSSYAFAGAGTHDYDLAAVDTGAATNLTTGSTLTFISPPANVQSTATLVADLTGGTDRETDSEGRTRLLQRLRTPGLSGNASDWIYTVEDAAAGQLRGFAWAGRNGSPAGWGTTDYCALLTTGHRDDRHIAITDAMYSTIAAAVAARMPQFAVDLSRQLAVYQVPTTLWIRLQMADNAPASSHADWDAEALGATVVSTDIGSKQVQTSSTSLPSYLSAGDRVVIGGAAATALKVGIADGLSDDRKFEVDQWFTVPSSANPYPVDPQVGWRICSGGGIILDVVGALHDLLDSLGPEKGSYAAQIPGWEDILRLSAITTAAIQAGGGSIVDVTIDAPLADTTPTPDTSAQTHRIVADDLAVWEVM